jgi:hypothetical protein
MFKSYIDCISKATTNELEISLMKSFIEEYPDYAVYYNSHDKYFYHDRFLCQMIDTGKLDPNGSTIWNGELVKNIYLFIQALIINKHSYYKIKQALPVFLRKIRVDLFETMDFSNLLCKPYNKNKWNDFEYMNIQSLVIDKFLTMFPEKKYVFEHLNLRTIEDKHFTEFDHCIEYNHKFFLASLKYESSKLKELFPFV